MSKEDVLLFGNYGMRGSGKSYYEKLKEQLKTCSKEYLIKQLEYSYKEIERLKEEIIKLQTKLEITGITEYFKGIDFIENIKEGDCIDKTFGGN